MASPRPTVAAGQGSRIPALRRWPTWSPIAAALWSVLYAVLGAFWAAGGAGYPFGEGHDPVASASILRDVSVDDGARGLAVVGVLGVLVALGMTRPVVPIPGRWLLAALGTALSIVLAIVIPDYRVLVVVAYTPIVVLGAPFGWPPDTDLLAVLSWSVIHQLMFMVGGVMFAASTIASWRRWQGVCAYCGRGEGRSWTDRERAARWGRRATYVAVAVPLVYAATRWAWALGIPLGISEAFLREGQQSGLWMAGAALSTLAVVGAILTLGLTQPWGDVLPRRMPGLGGRRVPTGLATVPAAIVALIVTSAGLMFWRLVLDGGFTLGTGETLTLDDSWAALLPELIWPVWGIALGVAAWGYHLRRRGRCRVCGRG